MEDKLIKGLVIVAAGIVSTKAIKAVRKYREDEKLHHEIIEDADND